MTSEAFQYQFRNVIKELPKISLLGIRGYTEVNRPLDVPKNIYDDAILRCIDGVIDIYKASVDPGKFYINNPLNPQGCAKLKCGLWHYIAGEHHSKAALIQGEEFTVERLDKQGKKVGEESGWFGINIHSGGPEYLVGRYSAGCQVIWSSEPWKREWLEFYTPIVAGIEIFRQKEIPYLLVDRLEAIPVETVS